MTHLLYIFTCIRTLCRFRTRVTIALLFVSWLYIFLSRMDVYYYVTRLEHTHGEQAHQTL